MKYIERLIVKQCISDLLESGYVIGVNDGEETVLGRSKDAAAIFEAMDTTDEDYLLVYPAGKESRHCGWVRFIYGNDGPDVMNDYTTNLEQVLTKTFALIKEVES